MYAVFRRAEKLKYDRIGESDMGDNCWSLIQRGKHELESQTVTYSADGQAGSQFIGSQGDRHADSILGDLPLV